MLSNILGVFFSSKSAEVFHVASDSLEKHFPAFFFCLAITFKVLPVPTTMTLVVFVFVCLTYKLTEVFFIAACIISSSVFKEVRSLITNIIFVSCTPDSP